MKKFKHILYTCLFISCISTGCNEYLDVNPAGKVTQTKLFEDIQGYRDAMYGVYANLATTNLYGKNLTYGFADQLAQLFTPKATVSEEQTAYNTLRYNYTYPAVENIITTIWTDTYKVISYLNNIIENIEGADLNAHSDYPLIKGEAYALRGFPHFDIMRYFCETIQNNPNAGGIPYAYTFDLKNKEVCTLKECYDNVLADLTTAQQLLVNDTLQLSGEYRNTTYNYVNLYGVYAMKARVFHYKGQLDSAGYYAEKVIASPNYRLITSTEDVSKAMRYPGQNEMIWGLWSNKLYESLFQEFMTDPTASQNIMFVRPDAMSMYQDVNWSSENHDYRWNNFFKTEGNNILFARLLDVDRNNVEDMEAQQGAIRGICMLRLPEMYYIAAESLFANGKQEMGQSYLEAVRRSRGLGQRLEPATSLEEFQNILLKERRKEFWGEGQTFLDYKRTNSEFSNVNNTSTITLSSQISVLPWPRNEQEFGSINK